MVQEIEKYKLLVVSNNLSPYNVYAICEVINVLKNIKEFTTTIKYYTNVEDILNLKTVSLLYTPLELF